MGASPSRLFRALRRRHWSCRRALLLTFRLVCQLHRTLLQVANNSPARLPHGTAQPFYHCLVDVRDAAPGPHVSYVAQDNVQITAAPASADTAESAAALSERMVLHPLLPQYFTHFRPDTGTFTPVPALEQLYPDDSTVSTVAAAVAADLGTRGDADAAFAALAGLGAVGPSGNSSPSNRSMQLR